jgi:hypothetical protein
MAGPPGEWVDETCTVCPAQHLGPGGFDVVDGPRAGCRFDPAVGCRVDGRSGVPVCVHPFRVGLAPGAYASAGVPVRVVGEGAVFTPSPNQLVLPDRIEDLEAWFIAVVRSAAPAEIGSALEQAETAAAERFTGDEVLGALRRVLAGLAG